MKKVVRLTESQLVNIIKKVIKEEEEAASSSGLKDCLIPIQKLGLQECFDKSFGDVNDILGTNLMNQISKFYQCAYFKKDRAVVQAAVKEVVTCLRNKGLPVKIDFFKSNAETNKDSSPQ